MADYILLDEQTFFSTFPPYMIRNPSLKKYRRFSVSISSLPDEYYTESINAIHNEITRNLYKEIFKKEDYDENADHFLDIRNKSKEDICFDLLDLMRHHRYCLLSFDMMKILHKNPLLNREYDISFDRLSNLHSTQGKIGETFIMINHQRALNNQIDNLIMLFNEVELSLKVQEEKLESFDSNKHRIDVEYGYSIKDPQFIYTIENVQSNFYHEFLANTRANKIFKIIN